LSSEELSNAVFNDPSVAFHYADFKVSRTQVLTLGQDRKVYVSYRIGAEIFWTRKTLSLHKGETVITDGIHEARTRCGNRISAIAEAPVSSREPPIEVFDAAQNPDIAVRPKGPDFLSRHFGPQMELSPEVNQFTGTKTDNLFSPGISPIWQGPNFPSIIPWGPPPPPPLGVPSLPPIGTPEPGTGPLILSVLSGLWLVRKAWGE
jgi:hypothetical protein